MAGLPVTLGIVVAYGIVAAQEGQVMDPKHRFYAEAPKAWEEFRQKAKALEGTFTEKGMLLACEKCEIPVGEVLFHNKVEIKQGKDCVLYRSQSLLAPPKDASGRVRAANPKYAFELLRDDEVKDWALSKLKPGPPNQHPFATLAQEVETWTNLPICISYLNALAPAEEKGYLGRLINEPDFILDKIMPAAGQPGKGVKLDFHQKGMAKNSRLPNEIKGWLILDPARNWCILEYDLRLDWEKTGGVSYAAKYEYGGGQEGLPMVKSLDVIYTGKSSKSRYTLQFDFKRADNNVQAFTLSAFGLPEPVGVTWPKATRWWLWISLGAAASLVLGLLFARLKRRSPPPAPAAQ